ncbi:MAG: hypothetical protein RLZZ546_1070 [Bacteroidota bacterium]|jgi:hypothetical protein
MKEEEEVEITSEHLTIMRESYDCQNLTDDDIIQAMVKWDNMRRNGKGVIVHLAFPNFQCVLDNINNIKRKK